MELAADVLYANRYRLLKELGRGSFWEVWLAQDEQLDMPVAVKVYIALDDRSSESEVNSDAHLIKKTFGFENISDQAIVTSSSGLRYYIVSPGDDKRAEANDDVYVTYTVSLIDGTIVDDAPNDVIRFKPSRVIKGMQESFGYIGNGGEIVLIIPPELAFGESGGGTIPANATIMMHIKLVQIIHVLD